MGRRNITMKYIKNRKYVRADYIPHDNIEYLDIPQDDLESPLQFWEQFFIQRKEEFHTTLRANLSQWKDKVIQRILDHAISVVEQNQSCTPDQVISIIKGELKAEKQKTKKYERDLDDEIRKLKNK